VREAYYSDAIPLGENSYGYGDEEAVAISFCFEHVEVACLL